MAPLATDTLPPATTTNCYIIGERELFVIDPATTDPRERQRLFDLCDELQADGRRVAGVIATHHHPDHVGAVAQTAERYGVAVYGHALTLERIDCGAAEQRVLADGDQLELGQSPDGSDGWKLTAHFTPGHDRGHLVFIENRYDTAIVGDMVSTVSTIVIDPPEGDMTDYIASLQRLRELPIKTLCPAHGPTARRGQRVINAYLEHRAGRENLIVEALGRGVENEDELLPLVYADTPRELYGLAARSLLAGLEKLEREGRARRSGQRWQPA